MMNLQQKSPASRGFLLGGDYTITAFNSPLR